MTLYYQILATRKIPGELLTYSYEKQLNLGQLVAVLIRGKLVDGVVFDFIKEENLVFDKKKAKSISKILPACLNEFQLNFLKLLSFNTFNSKNTLFKGFYQPFSYLTNGNWLELAKIWSLDEIKNLEKKSENNFDLKDLEILEAKKDLEQNLKIENKLKINSLDVDKKNVKKPSISVKFELNSDYVVRIINLIRSQKYSQKPLPFVNILIIFPEQKLLDKIFQGVQREFISKDKINFYKYSNNGNKDAKYTARRIILDNFHFLDKYGFLPYFLGDLLNLDKQVLDSNLKSISFEEWLKNIQQKLQDKLIKPLNKEKKSQLKSLKEVDNSANLTSYNTKINLFFTTRSGMFLPFLKLDQILLIDEANSMYIQEQNSLYFDTRDAVYLMAKSYGCDLTYISSLPSLRLFQNYNKDGLLGLLNQESYQQEVNFQIQTTQLNPQDKNQLLSPEVENLILGDEEYPMVGDDE